MTLPFHHPAHLVATVFGVGHLRPAPGTWGSLAALPVAAYAIFSGLPWLLPIAALVAFAAGLWASAVMIRDSDAKDPGMIVIDEVAGQLMAAIPIAYWPPGDWQGICVALAVAFVLFRLFDIAKPWPIKPLDRHVPGAFGIMIDDVAAGLIAGLGLTILLQYGVLG